MATKPKPTPLTKLPRAERDKRIAELVKKPGTRASIPTNLLPANYRRQREENLRLRQPIVPGSTITNRDAGREANAAVGVRYGQPESEINQEIAARTKREGEISSYYDSYLKELQAHQANTTAVNQQALQQIGGLANIQGPTQAAPQDASNQQAGANAQAVREALLGAMKGSMVEGGRAATTYADTLARVVGPGQKLGAQIKAGENTQTARQALVDLGREKGSYRDQFLAQARADETKNVLSRQALGLDAAKADADAAAGRATRRESRRHNKASENNTRTSQEQAAADRNATGYGAGRPGQNSFGYTYDEWNALTPAQRDKARAGKPKDDQIVDPQKAYEQEFYKKYGVKPVSTEAVNSASDTIQSTKSLVDQIRGSDGSLTRKQIGDLLLSGQKGGKDALEIPKTKGIWATVALDLAFLDGRISAGTANRLHKQGYSVKSLGLSTAKPKLPPANNGKPAKPRSGANPVGTDLGQFPGSG